MELTRMIPLSAQCSLVFQLSHFSRQALTLQRNSPVLRQAKNSVSFLPSPCLCKHQGCANSLKTTSGLSFRIPRKFQFIPQRANRGSVCAPLGVIEIWQYTVAEAGPSLYRRLWAQCLMLQRGGSRASEQSGRMDVRWGREKKKRVGIC